jgi:hypothetical protein
LDWVSLLNDIRELTLSLRRAFTLSNYETPFERYRTIFLICLCAAYKEEEYCKVKSNPILQEPLGIAERLLTGLDQLVSSGIAISGEATVEAMKKAEALSRRSTKPKFIYFFDAFSLPEYLFFASELKDAVSLEGLLYSVNPGGMTRTFEHISRGYVRDFSSNLTLDDVANSLKQKMSAAGTRVFRNIDHAIHDSGGNGFLQLEDLIEALFQILEVPFGEIRQLLDDYRVVLVADHGYDVYFRDDRWRLLHGIGDNRGKISAFIPVMVFG